MVKLKSQHIIKQKLYNSLLCNKASVPFLNIRSLDEVEVLQDIKQITSMKRIPEIAMNISEMTITSIVGSLIGGHVGNEQNILLEKKGRWTWHKSIEIAPKHKTLHISIQKLVCRSSIRIFCHSVQICWVLIKVLITWYKLKIIQTWNLHKLTYVDELQNSREMCGCKSRVTK